jgi:lipopolysaccharide export system protein LptA
MPNGGTATRSRIGRAAPALVLLVLLSCAAPGQAQTGFPGAGGEEGPIRIQADAGIEWQQNRRLYIARGNAVAARGDNEVRADMLIAYYRDKRGDRPNPQTAANAGLAGEGGGGTEIFRVEAVGNVVLKHAASTVTGQRAVYDIDQGIAVVTGGNLRLTTASDVVTARDSLEWYDTRQVAVARGDAVATRAGKTIKADILTAHMQKSSPPRSQGTTQAGSAGKKSVAPAGPGAQGSAGGGGKEGESRLSRVDAQGNVVITDALNTGRGDYGVYNGATGIATLIGNVVIQRGANVIRGQRGVMDLNNNIARLMPGGGPGEGNQRVQGLFVRDPTVPGITPAGDRRQP